MGPQRKLKSRSLQAVAMVLGQGCGETLPGLQGSWVACICNHGNGVGWGRTRKEKRKPQCGAGVGGGGTGDRVNSRAAQGPEQASVHRASDLLGS